MNNISMPADYAKQWEILILVLASEENKIDRTTETEVDTMKYFYNNKGVRKVLTHWLHQMNATYARKTSESDTALKCNDVSLLWRQCGNEKFKVNLLEESYKCYSKSLLYAKPNTHMYALAAANRSATLLRLKRYQECLSDINLAISNGYPKDQLLKLYLRRAECYIESQQRAKAQISLDAAVHNAKTTHLSANNILEFERQFKLLETKLQILEGDGLVKEPIILPECYLGFNRNFNAASNAIELRRNDTVGRHVVAKKDVRRGDVLFSEEPYAWVTLPSEDSVCEMCCKADINLVPCTVCSRTVYCSEGCRARAVFHRWECSGAQCSLFPAIGIAHLALRVLLISAGKGFPTSPLHLPTPCTALQLFESYTEVDNINVYEIDTPAFYRMFNLVTNFDKMNKTDYTQYALTALMLTLYLENFTRFFEYLPRKLPYAMRADELRLFAAAIILRSLGQLVCNGHATLCLSLVEEDDVNSGRTLTEKEIRRATAIYPSAAMMNHSCDPNIINTFYNSRLIIRCSRELSPGMEVLNCYGPHRARQTTAQRRAELRAQYMFTCNCAPCSDQERKDFVLLFSAYACQSCRGPVLCGGREPRCQQCKTEFHPERAMAVIDQAEDLASHAEGAATVEERCSEMCAAYRLKQQVWHKHHSSLRAAADRLARLYADAGEYGKSMELIKHNIQSLEYQFGSFSVEVAHELRKLSDVMVEKILNMPQHVEHRDICLEAHKVVKKAVQLMELNYGVWEPTVMRLMKQETFVASLLAETSTSNSADSIHHSFHYNLKI